MFFDSYDTPVFRPPSEARSFILRCDPRLRP